MKKTCLALLLLALMLVSGRAQFFGPEAWSGALLGSFLGGIAGSDCLSGLSLDIAGARISTEKAAAIDSCFVRELDGKKVLGAPRQKTIEKQLVKAIHELELSQV